MKLVKAALLLTLASAAAWEFLADNDAVRLFVARAQTRLPAFRLEAANAEQVAAMVRATAARYRTDFMKGLPGLH